MKEFRGIILQVVTALILVAVFGALLFAAIKARRWAVKKTAEEFAEKENSYTLVVDEEEWGPSVISILLNAGPGAADFSDADMSAENFTVSVKTQTSVKLDNSDSIKNITLKVSDASFCDIDGNSMERDENPTHILLDLDLDGFTPETSLFLQDEKGIYWWKTINQYTIQHNKLTSNINVANDPIFSKEAKHKIVDMDIKQKD